jgi:hypothetical protein
MYDADELTNKENSWHITQFHKYRTVCSSLSYWNNQVRYVSLVDLYFNMFSHRHMSRYRRKYWQIFREIRCCQVWGKNSPSYVESICRLLMIEHWMLRQHWWLKQIYWRLSTHRIRIETIRIRWCSTCSMLELLDCMYMFSSISFSTIFSTILDEGAKGKRGSDGRWLCHVKNRFHVW